MNEQEEERNKPEEGEIRDPDRVKKEIF